MTHVLGAGVLATFLTVLTGGAFISFLRDRSLGQNIREKARSGTASSKARRPWAACSS